MRAIQRTVKRASHWYIQLWDVLSGKNHQRLRQLQQTLATLQQTNTDLQQRLLSANSQITDLNQALTLSQQSEAQLKQQLNQNTVQYEQLQQHLKISAYQLQQNLTAFQQTEIDLKQQLTNAQQQCQALQQNLENSTQNEADLRKHLVKATNQCSALEKELAGLLTYSDHEIHSLEAELESQQSAFANCQVQLGEALATVSRTSDNTIETPLTPLSLAEWKIALVGGHENTTRGVYQRLKREHNLQALVEIPSVHMPQQQLKQKLENCDLIVSIVGYSNHALTQSIAQLKHKGALRGELLPVNCRGVSGVVREIVSFIQKNELS